MNELHSRPPIAAPLSPKRKKQLLSASKENVFGIEHLKEVQIWKADMVQEVYNVVKKAQNRKSFTGWMLLSFWDEAFALGSIIKNADEIDNEINDLSQEEKIELNKVFKDALNIPEEHIEEFSRRTDYMINEVIDYVNYCVDVFKK